MKSLRIILLSLLCLIPFCGQAQPKDLLQLDVQTEVFGKSVKLNVGFNNAASTNYTAFQIDLRLPEEFEYSNYSISPGLRLLGHVVNVALQPNNVLRVTAFSTNNAEIGGRSGVLFSIVAAARPSAQIAEYAFIASHAEFTQRDGQERAIADAQINFNFAPYDLLKSFDLVYMVDNQEYKRITLKEGETVPPIDNPVKDGHTFMGWKNLPATMPSSHCRADAEFSVNSYIVTFYLNDVIYSQKEVKFGDTIVPPHVEDTAKEKFTGWSEYPATMPSRNVNVFGKTMSTGIETLTDNSLVDVFNLQGIRVMTGVTLNEAKSKLPKGIYIVNGQKLFIR